MKFIKCVFFLAAYSLSMNFASADEQTPYAYGRKDFCSEEAKERIKKLNQMTQDDVKEIESLKKNINDLEAKKKIIEDLKSIRNDYLSTMESVTSGGESEIKKDIKINSIEKFKSLLRNATTLNAISLLTKNNLLSKITTPNIESLCESDAANANLAMCKAYNPKNLSWGVKKWRNTEITAIDKTLLNFSNTMDKVSDVQGMTLEINGILDSIPQKIGPQFVLEVLANKAPNLMEILSNAQTKTEVENCLNNNSNSCENLISDPANRPKLNALLGKESQEFQADLKDHYAQVKNQISVKYTTDLSKILNSYNNPSDASNNEMNRTIINEKTNQVLTYSEKLFKADHPNAASGDTPNAFTAINFSNDDYLKFKKDCIISDNLDENVLDNQIAVCGDHVKDLVGKVDSEKNKIAEQTSEYRAKLDQLLNHNPKLERIEKLKQYIAQRFMRSCPQASDSDNGFLISNISSIKCDMGNRSDSNTGIQDLSNSFSSILGRMQEGNTITKTKGDLGAFSKPEMNVYNEYCKDNNPDPVVTDTCRDINDEHNRLSNLRDTKDWDDFNKKYWVENSKSSIRGYEVYEKKSNARILGEGLSQNINKIFPIWFGNFQLTSQIDSMTNQALYMSQLNYMNNPTSPWMLNNPYFQGNYFGATGAFTGLGATSMPTTNGFNFSK
ncbi:MAG: hypothetical protein PHY93_02120 [Bacteriovorax sp.]|nr:hypothetical protein [Bacteriovorax sp.]